MAIFTPKEVTDNYLQASIGKATSPAWRLFVLGIAAGALISMGAVASSTAACTVEGFGMTRWVSGLIFPIGLIMVILLGTELFRGNALMVTAAIAKKITWGQLARNWVLVYFGNFVGAIGVAALMAFFGQLGLGDNTVAAYSAKVAASKSSMPWMNVFVLGIFCNLLVCVAVYLGNTAQDTAGRILGIFFPIMGFVTAGFEHCIANMYYIPAGIFATMVPGFSDAIVALGVNTEVLTWGNFVFANLVPATLGNIVGGALVGIVMYACHATKASKPTNG